MVNVKQYSIEEINIKALMNELKVCGWEYVETSTFIELQRKTIFNEKIELSLGQVTIFISYSIKDNLSIDLQLKYNTNNIIKLVNYINKAVLYLRDLY